MEKVPFVNLRHNLAPEEGMGQVYIPTGLLTAGSRAIQAGADIEFQDGNLRPLTLDHANIVGVSVIGAPYIPEIQKQIGIDRSLIVGGQVVKGITRASMLQFVRLFGNQAWDGNDDSEVAQPLKIRPGEMPPVMATSLIPAYERLSSEDLKAYLSTEMSFFLSKGCKEACTFCAVADRTRRDPFTNELQKMAEQYRALDIVQKDLSWLTDKAKEFGIEKLEIYLSNLDLFQTPVLLKAFANIVLALKNLNPGFQYRMRALCTTKSFVIACRKHPKTVQAMVDAGLHMLGFGVDGDPEADDVKKSVHKKFNTVDNCIDAIRLARENGITPETLMVFGHAKDTEHSLAGAVSFAERMQRHFGAIPRPHMAKEFIPGNDGWYAPENHAAVETLIQDPDLFHNDDFTCEASELTHPDPQRRALVNRYFRMMGDIKSASTRILYAREPKNPKLTVLHTRMNTGRYDH